MKAWGDPPIPRGSGASLRLLPDPTVLTVSESPIYPGPFLPVAGQRNASPIHSWPAGSAAGAIASGSTALLRLGESIGQTELIDPVIASAYRFARSQGVRVNVPRLLAAYARAADRAERTEGFPWAFDPGGGPGPLDRSGTRPTAIHWRPRDRDRLMADPSGYARWLVEPIAQVQTLELLAELAGSEGALGEAAGPIRNALLPSIEAGFALHVAADDPWRDLFALWLLTRAPVTLNDLWYLATAIAYRYATMARRVAGPVLGTGPFEGEQLVSASAALGTVLWQLRIYPSLVPELVAFVADRAGGDGGWGDPGQPTDVLTTLIAADFLLGIDPTFDPQPTIDWFARAQDEEGWWRALGPEVPWLTAAVVDWLVRATGPVVARFRWPGALKLDLDRRTQLPTFAWFADLVRSVAEVHGLAAAHWDIAFVDLAGFGAFNTEHGQAKGDDVIGEFGRALDRIPGCRVIRDGGDEFILIGTPGDNGLYDRLDAFRSSWLDEFTATFGAIERPVRPRITVSRSLGSDLVSARERLGRRIGELKKASPDPPDDGVIERA